MEDVIGGILARVRRDRPRFISIGEPNHYSHSAHTFHFELLKRLLAARAVDVLASERLGMLDAVLLNGWLAGRFPEFGAAQFFAEVLPLGGMGTLRWARFLRAHPEVRARVRLVGLEADFNYFLEHNGPAHPATLACVRRLCSAAFARRIRRLDEPARLPPNATETDREVARALRLNARHRRNYGARFRIWAENLRALPPGARVFCNGYHLARGEEIAAAAPRPRLHIGMASHDRDQYTEPLSRGWLRRNGLRPADYVGGTPGFWAAYHAQYTDRGMDPGGGSAQPVGYRSRFNAGRVANAARAARPTRLERAFRGQYKLLAVNAENESEEVHQWGWDSVPVIRGLSMEKGVVKTIKGFDLVAFIPRSTFRVRMCE